MPTTDRWEPQKTPKGPVTIIVSGRDGRIVILRNGVEIGSGEIAIDRPVTTMEAFTLNGVIWLEPIGYDSLAGPNCWQCKGNDAA